MSGSEPCLEDIYPAPPPPPNGQGIVVFTVGHRTLGLKPLVDNLECVGGVCGSVCGLSGLNDYVHLVCLYTGCTCKALKIRCLKLEKSCKNPDLDHSPLESFL